MKRGFPILAIVTAVLLSFALYEALIGAPTERSMGDVQRIFYYHVPSAWTAFLLFFVNFGASIAYLVKRRPALGQAPPRCRYRRPYLCRSWSRVLNRQLGHRPHLGAPGLGHLVDLGLAPHLHPGDVAHLR